MQPRKILLTACVLLIAGGPATASDDLESIRAVLEKYSKSAAVPVVVSKCGGRVTVSGAGARAGSDRTAPGRARGMAARARGRPRGAG